MHNLKDRLMTALIVVSLLLAVGLVFLINESIKKKDALVFAFNHSDLVDVVRVRYATEEAKVKDGFIKKEKTAQDQLIEAVAEQVAVSKN